MINIPVVKLGIVAVSRDCFPKELSQKRVSAVNEELKKRKIEVVLAKTIVENETDAQKALEEVHSLGVNALVIYLGNFGPEGPETLLAQKFSGCTMFYGAEEETQTNLIDGRGDAFCGMLNASYNCGLRNLKTYIPKEPIGSAKDAAKNIEEFLNLARIIIGLSSLKIITFGPRPYDFLACNAPIKPLFDLGVEIQENSELDLFAFYNEHKNDKRVSAIVSDMQKEIGTTNNSEFLERLATFELTLEDWAYKNLGSSKYVAFANKCWPAFQTQFGFVPCYVNSRFTAKGIPIACETDIYGALTEFIITAATCLPPTLLDINNTVPKDMYDENKNLLGTYKNSDIFMGFHCGNTPFCHIDNGTLKHQLIMKRSLEPDSEPNITRGTLEGKIKKGDVTLFRLQATAEGILKSYIAEGEVLDIDPKSFGGIGVIAVPEMARFYRNVLIEKKYPHHAGVAFKHAGKDFFRAMKYLGISEIDFNRPSTMLYENENPFK